MRVASNISAIQKGNLKNGKFKPDLGMALHILLNKANKQGKYDYTSSKDTSEMPLHNLNPIAINC